MPEPEVAVQVNIFVGVPLIVSRSCIFQCHTACGLIATKTNKQKCRNKEEEEIEIVVKKYAYTRQQRFFSLLSQAPPWQHPPRRIFVGSSLIIDKF